MHELASPVRQCLLRESWIEMHAAAVSLPTKDLSHERSPRRSQLEDSSTQNRQSQRLMWSKMNAKQVHLLEIERSSPACRAVKALHWCPGRSLLSLSKLLWSVRMRLPEFRSETPSAKSQTPVIPLHPTKLTAGCVHPGGAPTKCKQYMAESCLSSKHRLMRQVLVQSAACPWPSRSCTSKPGECSLSRACRTQF